MLSRIRIIALCSILLFSSCTKDDNTAPSDIFSSSSNAKFLGTWYNSETSKLYGDYTYYVNIADSTDNSFVLISTLYGYKTKIKATISANTLTIPAQVIEANLVSGEGSLLMNKRIELTYVVDTGLEKDTVTSVLTK